MPKRDGTGPDGKGHQTGRGQGRGELRFSLLTALMHSGMSAFPVEESPY